MTVEQKDQPIGLDLSEVRSFLEDLLPEAASLITSDIGSKDLVKTDKGGVDFLTQQDKDVEDFLYESISQRFPGHQFLMEETSDGNYEGYDLVENLWVIDPIDGTNNFTRGDGDFGISVALVRNGETLVGAVYVPTKDKFYIASKDVDGAFLNGQRLQVSRTSELKATVMACDWSWDLEKRKTVVEWIGKLNQHVRQIKMMGSAVADLGKLAEGKIDAYLHSGLKPWDIAAAGFLVEKAGGTVTLPDGKTNWGIFNGAFLGSNGIIHQKIVELIEN